MAKRFIASFIIVAALINMFVGIVENSQSVPTTNDFKALLTRRIKDHAPIDVFISPHHLIASGTVQQVGGDFFCLDAIEGTAQCFQIAGIESVTVNMNQAK